MSLPTVPLTCALTIATSDSGGGAGIQADLKTFAANHVFGLSVIAAVTAQNTVAVTGLECLSPAMVTAQLQALYDDLPVAAIKIGLLGSAANTKAVAAFLAEKFPRVPVVVDPVMVSTSGHTFLPPDAVAALQELMALATVATPNLPEAEALSGLTIRNNEDRAEAARIILESGARHVLIKGGHGREAVANDLLVGADGRATWFNGPRVDTPNTHGTGCTLSSAIGAHLARGLDLPAAVALAKDYVTAGLRHSLTLGRGPGPLNHFHPHYLFH